MKKPSTLAQQVQQAQRIVDGWTPERKASVRLQGSSRYALQLPPSPASLAAAPAAKRRQKEEA